MGGHANSKRQLLLSARKSFLKHFGNKKKVFLAICLFSAGVFILILTTKDSLIFHPASLLPKGHELPNYVRETSRHSSEHESLARTIWPKPPNYANEEQQHSSEHETSAKTRRPEPPNYANEEQQHSSEHERSRTSSDSGDSGVLGQADSNNTKESVAKTSALDKLSKHLRHQVDFLRDAIEEVHHQDLPLAKSPNCTGDLIHGEVEDMLCIPRPEFIKGVRNPCWWDKNGTNSTLRCLPFFHILGCEKCASSDLWDRITSHPHTVRINGIHDKEANWWGWLRYGRFHYFKGKLKPFIPGYTDYFSPLTQKVEESLRSRGNNHKVLVTGDGSPSDLMDFRGWINMAQNRGRKLPHVLTPHLMKHIYPETTKFIIILRDPIERLYSDFVFATVGKSAQHFHENLMQAIGQMADCVRKRSVRQCFFGLQMYRRGHLRLHLILYTPYIMEWLKVIPRERFLFLKTDEYEKDPHGTVQRCFEFLGLEPLSDESMAKIVKQPHALQGKKKKWLGPMWQSTKEILEEIIRPSMHFLPELLQDDRFVWDFDSTPVRRGH